jgi:hypothetical protein
LKKKEISQVTRERKARGNNESETQRPNNHQKNRMGVLAIPKQKQNFRKSFRPPEELE